MFGMLKDSIEVIRTTQEQHQWTFTAHNVGGTAPNKKIPTMKRNVFENFAGNGGVEDINVWHERLAHTCPEYIRLMVDRGMAKGITLKRRRKLNFADYWFGKQRRQSFQRRLRGVSRI